MIALAKGTDQSPPPQFTNVHVEKKVPPMASPKHLKDSNPVVIAKEKRKVDIVAAGRDKKLKVNPIAEQVCLHHFQKIIGLKTDACANKSGPNGKCLESTYPDQLVVQSGTQQY